GFYYHYDLATQSCVEVVGKDEPVIAFTLRGLTGGHTGADIHRGRMNAVVTAATAIYANEGARLVKFWGGQAKNSIPREIKVVVAGVTREGMEGFSSLLRVHSETDPHAEIVFDTVPEGTLQCVSRAATDKFLSFILDAPTGVLAMSKQVEGLTETSHCVAIAHLDAAKGVARITASGRSAIPADLESLEERMRQLGQGAGLKLTGPLGKYMPWPPVADSRLLTVSQDAFEELYPMRPVAEGC
ncbi:hypothetical protein KIPB_013335, partial [Kipferlia bialata]